MSDKQRHFDFLVVGAGLSGMVMAEQLCGKGYTCLVIDRRPHIGGNCYDCLDEHGVLIHPYGPHYFRTNSKNVFAYLSRFTEWLPQFYTFFVWAKERFWNFPINLNTFQQYLGRSVTQEQMQAWLEKNRCDIPNPSNSEELILSRIGRGLYELFFKGYITKQWGCEPAKLAPSACGRIPIRTNRDNRYFDDEIQALPAKGYTAMFERMREACGSRMEMRLSTGMEDVMQMADEGALSFSRTIYTGPIDAYFGNCYGRLPYRSLRFEREHFTKKQLAATRTLHGSAGFWQRCVQVNYPNEEAFTRIVEVKHITGQECDGSTIVREYPVDFTEGMEPYYPVPSDESDKLYACYAALAANKAPDTVFLGRLARYRYLNMDQVVAFALDEAKNFPEKSQSVGVS